MMAYTVSRALTFWRTYQRTGRLPGQIRAELQAALDNPAAPVYIRDLPIVTAERLDPSTPPGSAIVEALQKAQASGPCLWAPASARDSMAGKKVTDEEFRQLCVYFIGGKI